MTGDLQSVEIKRHVFFTTLTNRRFLHTNNLFQLFKLPSLQTQIYLKRRTIYYDIQCNTKDLHMTVLHDYDENGKEILIIQVYISLFMAIIIINRKLREKAQFTRM